MTWSYTGDPSSGDKDKYRFIIGDTNANEPILQDGEIEFVISEYSDHNTRLYQLYDAAAQFFARKIKRTVGPIKEEPWARQRHYEIKAAQYKKLISSVNVAVIKASPTIFNKGMHDNGGY